VTASRLRRQYGKHDDIMRSGRASRGRTVSGSVPGRRRRLLRGGSISRDRLNLDGRRNKIIDVSSQIRATHKPHTHTYHNYSYDTRALLLMFSWSTFHVLSQSATLCSLSNAMIHHKL